MSLFHGYWWYGVIIAMAQIFSGCPVIGPSSLPGGVGFLNRWISLRDMGFIRYCRFVMCVMCLSNLHGGIIPLISARGSQVGEGGAKRPCKGLRLISDTCFTVLLKFYHSIHELDLFLTISKNCIISIDFKQDIQINWHDVEMSFCPMPGAKRPLAWGKAPTHGCFAPYYFMIWIRRF